MNLLELGCCAGQLSACVCEQVRSARRPGEAATLANTWLARLRARAPPLALALDDALLALLEQGRALVRPLDPTPHPSLGPHAAADGLAAGFDTAIAPGPHAGSCQPGCDGLAVSTAPDGATEALRARGSESTLTGRVGVEQAAAGPREHESGHEAAASTADVAAAAAAAVAGEAAGAAAARLWVEALELGPLQLLLDVHVSGGSTVLPLALDTSRCALAQQVPRTLLLQHRPWRGRGSSGFAVFSEDRNGLVTRAHSG